MFLILLSSSQDSRIQLRHLQPLFSWFSTPCPARQVVQLVQILFSEYSTHQKDLGTSWVVLCGSLHRRFYEVSLEYFS